MVSRQTMSEDHSHEFFDDGVLCRRKGLLGGIWRGNGGRWIFSFEFCRKYSTETKRLQLIASLRGEGIEFFSRRFFISRRRFHLAFLDHRQYFNAANVR